MQPPPANNQKVNLMPLTLAVAELEVGPGAERIHVRQQLANNTEALGLVGELRARHLGPALRCPGHLPSLFYLGSQLASSSFASLTHCALAKLANRLNYLS